MSENKLRRLRFNGEDLFDLFYPIGYQYRMVAVAASNDPDVAFPPAERPENMWPDTTWERLWHLEGVFFRTEGGSHTSGRTDGLQPDQMQGHHHDVRGTATNPGSERLLTYSTFGFNELHKIATTMQSDGTNGTPRVGSETRPVNRLERVYRRTA